jgi:hypothetical protein
MDRRHVRIKSVRTIVNQSVYRTINEQVRTNVCQSTIFTHVCELVRLELATVFLCSPDLLSCFYRRSV